MLERIAGALALTATLIASDLAEGQMKDVRPKDCKPGYGRMVEGFLDPDDKSTRHTACLGSNLNTVEDKRRECAEHALKLVIHNLDEKHWCCAKK